MSLEISENQTHRAELLMKELGFVRFDVNYAGGNDSGGIESISATRPDRAPEPVEMGTETVYHQLPNGRWVEVRKLVPANQHRINELTEIAGVALDDYYGSWAGSYSAYGTITFTLDEEGVGHASVDDHYEEDTYDDEEEDEEWTP